MTFKLDYEVELGIVIGSKVPRFTSAPDAHNYIGGYTVIHDVSARDMQLEANGGQWQNTAQAAPAGRRHVPRAGVWPSA